MYLRRALRERGVVFQRTFPDTRRAHLLEKRRARRAPRTNRQLRAIPPHAAETDASASLSRVRRARVRRHGRAYTHDLVCRGANRVRFARTQPSCYTYNRPSDRRGPGLFGHEGRNVRSTCRCSHNLRITRRRAVSCGLHRPTSQVIHRSGLSLLRYHHSAVYLIISSFSRRTEHGKLNCRASRVCVVETHTRGARQTGFSLCARCDGLRSNSRFFIQ